MPRIENEKRKTKDEIRNGYRERQGVERTSPVGFVS